MDITKENFADAIKTDEFKNDIYPLITGMETIQTLITNKAEATYKSKIDDEVKKIHSQYDDDVFEILGVRPQTKEGVKEKTYDFLKGLYGELKDLREKKGSLDKDQAVIDLKAKIKTLEEGGGGKHVQEIFDKAKEDWATEKARLEKQVSEANESTLNLQKSTAFANAKSNIKINPDISEGIQKVMMEAAEAEFIKNSEIRDGQLVFLDAEGKPILNSEYKPIDANGFLSQLDTIKNISLKEDPNKGGGNADKKIEGSIQTSTVEGKDTKKLILPEGSFKTKSEFLQVAEKALIDSGVSRRDPEWDKLKNDAYSEHKVAELPVT